MTTERASIGQVTPRSVLRKILMLDDTAHSIAFGAAIGMFIGMTPTVGIQMILVLCLSVVTRSRLRFNKVAALLMVYVSNPFTVLPIYWFNYSIGVYFTGSTVTFEDFAAALEYGNFNQWLDTIFVLFVQVGSPLILGSLAVATIMSLLTYPSILRLVRKVRQNPSATAAAACGEETPASDDFPAGSVDSSHHQPRSQEPSQI